MGSVDIMRILIKECGCKADLRDEVCSKSHLIMTCTYIVCYGNVNHEQNDSIYVFDVWDSNYHVHIYCLRRNFCFFMVESEFYFLHMNIWTIAATVCTAN